MSQYLKNSITYIFALLFFTISLVACAQSDDDSSTQGQINKVYQQWAKAIDTAKGDPSAVAALYADDAVLLPTFSDQILSKKEQISDYFKQFTAYKNITVSTKQFSVQAFGDVAVANGIYRFHYAAGARSVPKTVEARFTFVYKKSGDKWLIVTQHSSISPDKEKIKKIKV